MNLTTTIETIYSKRPCSDGFAKLLNGLFKLNIDLNLNIAKQMDLLTDKQKKTEVTLLQILNNNGVRDAYWVLRCWEYLDYCLLNADVAESVLSIFENKHPDENRVRILIEGIRKFECGEINREELNKLAADAADAAAAAAADAAAYAAADAADAADADAAYAAADAADAADADAAADARQSHYKIMADKLISLIEAA